jgi:hypothetical protein
VAADMLIDVFRHGVGIGVVVYLAACTQQLVHGWFLLFLSGGHDDERPRRL